VFGLTGYMLTPGVDTAPVSKENALDAHIWVDEEHAVPATPPYG